MYTIHHVMVWQTGGYAMRTIHRKKAEAFVQSASCSLGKLHAASIEGVKYCSSHDKSCHDLLNALDFREARVIFKDTEDCIGQDIEKVGLFGISNVPAHSLPKQKGVYTINNLDVLRNGTQVNITFKEDTTFALEKEQNESVMPDENDFPYTTRKFIA